MRTYNGVASDVTERICAQAAQYKPYRAPSPPAKTVTMPAKMKCTPAEHSYCRRSCSRQS